MRPLNVLPVFSLLLGACASSLDSRGSTPDRRDTNDVCANLGTELVVSDQEGQQTTVGMIDQCLCQAEIPFFLETHIIGILASTIAGELGATDALQALIDGGSDSSFCNYPDHSVPRCTSDNVCAFRCTDGFSHSPASNPTTCACSAPSVICNGKCVAAGLCPSGQVVSKKRSWAGSGSCTDIGPGWAACGVLGGGSRAWECVNTARDLESCGGCVLPLTAHSPIGKDCSALPGVADVVCLSGECAVLRCLPGYLPALDGMSCIRKHPTSQSQFVDDEDVPASVYGLEHVPLGLY